MVTLSFMRARHTPSHDGHTSVKTLKAASRPVERAVHRTVTIGRFTRWNVRHRHVPPDTLHKRKNANPIGYSVGPDDAWNGRGAQQMASASSMCVFPPAYRSLRPASAGERP